MLHFTNIVIGVPKRCNITCLQKINQVNSISLWNLCENRERGGDIKLGLGDKLSCENMNRMQLLHNKDQRRGYVMMIIAFILRKRREFSQ
jgi:hypothetical protein